MSAERMSAERNMKASFTARGYGVIATLKPQEIGKIIKTVNDGDPENEWHHPFVITEETDLADYEKQCELAGQGTFLHPAYQFFYRVITD